MIVSCIAGNFSTVFVMEQINFACLISLGRINICHNPIRGKLHAFNGIGDKIFCDRIKLMNRSVFTDQHLLQRIRNLNSICNLIFYIFTIGCCI